MSVNGSSAIVFENVAVLSVGHFLLAFTLKYLLLTSVSCHPAKRLLVIA